MQYLQLTISLLILLSVLYIMTKVRSPRAAKNVVQPPLLLDSSVLIDGRILDIAQSGFLPSPTIIPSSVLREIQYLADNGDSKKRMRARHGLEIAQKLKEVEGLTVSILNDGLPKEGGVDEQLVSLAKKYRAKLVTLDFNLNQVAQTEDIVVLNINNLAQHLRMNYLPGEKRDITLVQKGQDKTQAVGYLEDGTMVVVENAAKYIGQSHEVEFTRAIQTQSGRMLFAKLTTSVADASQSAKSRQTKQTTRTPRKKRTPEDSLVELANQ